MDTAYWKKYNRLYKKFTPRSVFRLVLRFAQRLGKPFSKQGKRGRNLKVSSEQYSAYIAFMILTRNATFREMEFESELYLDVHIDHATLVVNFEKISPKYFLDLIEESAAYLDRLLEKTEQYVIDSTAITTPLKFYTMNKGLLVRELIEYRSHVIASLHPLNQTTCIQKALITSKKIAECEGARIMLENSTITKKTIHADKGYDYERVYRACYKTGNQPNIRPHTTRTFEGTYRSQGIYEYDNKTRKKYRGLIETIFGGLTNAGLLITRLRKETKILNYGAIVLLRHNIFNIMRNIELQHPN